MCSLSRLFLRSFLRPFSRGVFPRRSERWKPPLNQARARNVTRSRAAPRESERRSFRAAAAAVPRTFAFFIREARRAESRSISRRAPILRSATSLSPQRGMLAAREEVRLLVFFFSGESDVDWCFLWGGDFLLIRRRGRYLK